MIITSAMAFYLLSQNYCIERCYLANANTPLKLPRLYDNNPVEPGFLYIVESFDMYQKIKDAHNCAFVVLCNSSLAIYQKPDNNNVALILSDVVKNELFNYINEIFSELRDWNYQLTDIISNSNSIDKVFKIGHSFFKRPFCLTDTSYKFIAWTSDYNNSDTSRLPSINEMYLDDEFRNAEKQTDVYLYPSHPSEERFLCMNIINRDENQIRVLAELGTDEVSEGEKQLFSLLCGHIKKSFEKLDEKQTFKNDHLHILSKELILGSDLSLKKISEVIKRYGWEIGHEYIFFFIDTQNLHDYEIASLYLCRQLESQWKNSCAIRLEGGIAWIVNLTLNANKKDLIQKMAYFLRDSVCKAGISDKFSDYSNLRLYYLEAHAALRIGQKKNPHFWYSLFSDYTLDYLLESATGELQREQIYHKGLHALSEYDNSNNTDLLVTLRNYVDCIFNTGLAAEKSYVHRSTLLRRLEKIKEIGGIDFESLNDVLRLIISFKLMDA